MLAPWKESSDKPIQHIKKQRHHFACQGPSSQSYGFSSGHMLMWELNHKEGWAPKNWYFCVGEDSLESLRLLGDQSVNPKGNQPWIFIGGSDAGAKAPIFWPPDVKSWLTGIDPNSGKDWRQKEKGWQRIRWLDSITDDMNLSRLWRQWRIWGHKESDRT